MKYKVGDSFLAKATIESVDPKRRAPYFLDSSIGCGWWSESALNDYRMMNCDECKWKGKRHQKCTCCVRNQSIKDNYEN
jgi:hypothetical protein